MDQDQNFTRKKKQGKNIDMNSMMYMELCVFKDFFFAYHNHHFYEIGRGHKKVRRFTEN